MLCFIIDLLRRSRLISSPPYTRSALFPPRLHRRGSRWVQWWCLLILLASGCGSQALDTSGQQEDMIAVYQVLACEY